MPESWSYDPARLYWQWDHGTRRFGVYHPTSPAVSRLGLPAVFMGWTMADAVHACTDANAPGRAALMAMCLTREADPRPAPPTTQGA